MLKPAQDSQKGFAFIAVLLVLAMMFILVAVLLFQTSTSRLVAANEHDHLAALEHAESGIIWAHRRMIETNDVTDLLLGPNNSSSTDDNLIGLRDLSLTATSQFNSSNEDTASAIVSRDFDGQGSKSWEAIRIDDGTLITDTSNWHLGAQYADGQFRSAGRIISAESGGTPVPEPTAALLFGLGAILVTRSVRRR